MRRVDIETILEATLEDQKLSRSEKRVLKAQLDELEPSDEELAYLRNQAFDMAKQHIRNPQDRQVLDWLEDVVRTLVPRIRDSKGMAEAYFSPGDHCVERLSNFVRGARRKLDVCVFTITDDRIANALIEANRRGIDLRVISDNDKAWDRGSDIDRLRDAGVNLRVDHTDHHMHHKFAIADDSFLVTGSYNWTRSASKYNEENFVVVEDQRLVTEFQAEFDRLWVEFER